MINHIVLCLSISIGLLTGLSSSAFFLNDHLSKIINYNQHSAAQLKFALAQGNRAALNLTWKNTPLQSKQWLTLAKKIAKTQGEVAYQLAGYYQQNAQQAILWYQSAIRLNYPLASIALAKLYFKHEQYLKAENILAALPTDLAEALVIDASIVKINIAINQGKLANVNKIIAKYALLLEKTALGRNLLADISQYKIPLAGKQVKQSNGLATSCDHSIQLFATTIKHLKHLENLVADFKAQPINSAVCFSPVRYMAITALDCNSKATQAIRCHELNWQRWADAINTRYIRIMLASGGANVHFGMLYFDVKDGVDVIAHEVSHLLGFVDEYPLVSNHIKCRAQQDNIFAQNISVLPRRYQGERKVIRGEVLKQLAWAKHISSSTPILQAVTGSNDEQYWQLGTPEKFKDDIGLFHAQSCDDNQLPLAGGISAYKPLSQRTKLEYLELSLPSLYLLLIAENENHYVMPSFHYNIALAFFQQGNIKKASYWLGRAENWEKGQHRREKIRQGAF